MDNNIKFSVKTDTAVTMKWCQGNWKCNEQVKLYV